MRTAIKIGIAAVLGCCALQGGPSLAQGTAETAVTTAMASPAPAPSAATSSQSASELSKVEGEGVTIALPKVETPSLNKNKETKETEEEEEGELEAPKIPDSVKKTVKRLNKATEGVTLEDLNAAREAIAKLDILIDIEKRLSDLDKIRQEREEISMEGAGASGSLGMRNGQIPAAMLAPPPMPAPVVQAAPAPMPVIELPPPSVDIVRIAGSAGRYTATIKTGEDKTTIVREGDKLSDGSIVKNISARGLTLQRDKKTHTVDIKEVAVVLNGR